MPFKLTGLKVCTQTGKLGNLANAWKIVSNESLAQLLDYFVSFCLVKQPAVHLHLEL